MRTHVHMTSRVRVRATGSTARRDDAGSLVGRKHEFVCMRMTDQCPNGRSAPVICDQNTDSHVDTDGDVRVTSQLYFP